MSKITHRSFRTHHRNIEEIIDSRKKNGLFIHFKIVKILVALALLQSVRSAMAEIPNKFEPDYADAILAFNDAKYERAYSILAMLNKNLPKAEEILEMMALISKKQSEDAKSIEIFEKLIALKNEQKKPNREISPYKFELGTIYFRQKNFLNAKKCFEFADREKFNRGAANFFLGMIAVMEKDWSAADLRFNRVIDSGSPDLEFSAHFYLAQAYMKMSYPQGATKHFRLASEHADEYLNKKNSNPDTKRMAEQIGTSAKKALEPFDKSRSFASVVLTQGYDTNILSLPSGITDPDLNTGKKAFKTSMMLAAGYMSSPLNFIQVLPSIRVTGNYNWSKLAKTSEFISNGISLNLNRMPLDPFTYGLKLDGGLTFQNDYNSETSSTKYRPLLYSGTVGPLFKWEPSSVWSFKFDGNVTVTKFATDPDSGENVKSGNTYSGKFQSDFDPGIFLLNPGISLGYSLNQSKGAESRSNTVSGSLSNTMRLTDSFKLVESIDISMPKYPSRAAGSRSDRSLSYGVSGSFRITSKISLLAEGRYTSNTSNIAGSYSYSRFVTSAGCSISF